MLLSLLFIAAQVAPIASMTTHSIRMPVLRSESAIVRFADTGEVVLSKNADTVRPIASITKLLSGVVLSRARQAPDRLVSITEEDKDRRKWSRSHLRVGFTTQWSKLMQAALGASENRAMYAAVRGSGMSPSEFATAMNRQAAALHMANSHFEDAAGIDPANVSTARDLLKLIEAASRDKELCHDTQSPNVELICEATHRVLRLNNPNRLARSEHWDIVLGKTGYTVEAGRALVIRANIEGRKVDMVFLGAREMASVFGDASRVRQWLLAKTQGQQARLTR